MSKKQLLAELLNWVMPERLLPFLAGLSKHKLTVLAYHRICDISKEDFHFDYELISADRENFEYQVVYAKKHFNPISIGQLISYIEGRGELPKKPLLFTFDDGFDDNFLAAFPILKKHNVPATIFVSTDYINSHESIWFDKLAAYILNMQPCDLYIEEFDKHYQITNSRAERKEVASKILLEIKRIPNKQRLRALENIFNITDKSIDYINYEQSKMLSWTQILEMQASGISFGSHTESHPIMTMLEDDELVRELVYSKMKLEKYLGKCAGSIAFPNGGVDDFDDRVINKTMETGYKVGFSYIEGANSLPIANRYAIKRLHIEHYVSKSYFKSLLCLPGVFSNA